MRTERLPPLVSPWIVGALILLGLLAALVTYKASGSLATLARVQGSHTLAPRCAAPVFAAVQERTRRGGAAGALMLASPSLNPAALALTFMLFTTEVAINLPSLLTVSRTTTARHAVALAVGTFLAAVAGGLLV